LAEKLEKEVKALHDERDNVRQRVERLLAQLDALEL
jgi:ubiquinone biosynthesis protein UbiJ